MNARLQEMVNQAKAAGACALVAECEKFETVKDVLASEKGPMLAMWYATIVAKSRITKFEQTIRKDPRCWEMYCARLGVKL